MKIKEVMKKYAPTTIDIKKIGRQMAYAQGFTKGYLIRTNRYEEIQSLINKDKD
jgi:hypothetical protein